MDDLQTGRSLGDIVSDVVVDAQNLIRGEVALARAELDQKLEHAIAGLVWTFGGMFVAFAGFIVILMAAVYALTYVIPAWAASLAIGCLITAIGAGFTFYGIRMLSLQRLTPERTAANLQRDAQLVKEHV
jgi:uncharacterized membrane protein YqjE